MEYLMEYLLTRISRDGSPGSIKITGDSWYQQKSRSNLVKNDGST